MPRRSLTLVYLQQSDGIVATAKGRAEELNGPTQAQLQKSRDSNGLYNYYQVLPVSHPKSREWREKLGGSLVRDLSALKGLKAPPTTDSKKTTFYTSTQANVKSTASGYILADFPENYRLYEHVRVANLNGVPSSNGNARSANERRDCYLYGHPGGRKKRFRSPGEFLPHLIWLSTDLSANHENCECKICCPDELIQAGKDLIRLHADGKDKVRLGEKRDNSGDNLGLTEKKPKLNGDGNVAKVESRSNTSIVKKNLPVRSTSQPQIKNESQPQPKPQIQTQTQSTSQKPAAKPTPPQPAVQAPAAATPPALLSPTPLPGMKNYDQAVDAQCNKFLYRSGEVVWFNRGSAWGLAVITMRQLFKDQRHQDRPQYTVQPLSHPFAHPRTMTMNQEEMLRPWLAWSAPDPTHETLVNKGLTYDTVDWSGVLQRRYGPGDAEVDGSIFAAKAIDGCYTPFERLTSARTTVSDTQYNGVYCGGEKIWLGEAIRLRTGLGKDIMILHRLVERSSQTAKGAMSSDMFVVGDIYSFQTVTYNPQQPIPANTFLPVRVQEDLNYRNRITIANKSQISYWKLIQSQARLGLGEVKGRWYESRVLLPILKGQADFALSLSKGEIGDVGSMLNGRGDATNSANKLGAKRNDRLEAFGSAIPPGTNIEGRALNNPHTQPLNFPMDPALTAPSMAMNIDQPQEQTVNDTDMSEFVDVNQMDEGDYGQGYLGNLGNGGQF
ncbi:hypothetical protein MMC13_001074 [Lambiella insularis]|nr:hypothetical protein [Lambiella insularis]